MRYGNLLAGLAAAALAVGGLGRSTRSSFAALENFNDSIPPELTRGDRRFGGGNTQGSSRDTDHERHLNRLARKARRQTRLHGHSATSHRLLARASA